jgi:hypothetical protein
MATRKPARKFPNGREIAERVMLEAQRAKELQANKQQHFDEDGATAGLGKERTHAPDDHQPQSSLAQAPTVAPTGELRWIVPGLVGEGLTILAGRDKAGKSWLALDFAIAVANGGCALSSANACEMGCAVYVDYENGYRRLRTRLERLAPGGDYEEKPGKRKDMPMLVWHHGRLPERLDKLFEEWREVRGGDLKLIVFDAGKNLARLAGQGGLTDRGTRAAVASLLERMQMWALKHGIAALCLVRTPKRGPDPATAGVLGLADTILVLERSGDDAVLKVRSRDTADRAVALAFDAGHFAIVGEAETVRYSLQRSQIVEVLETAVAPLSPVDVAGALALPYANVRQMMYRMERSGEIKRQSRGRFVLQLRPENAKIAVTNVAFGENPRRNIELAGETIET